MFVSLNFLLASTSTMMMMSSHRLLFSHAFAPTVRATGKFQATRAAATRLSSSVATEEVSSTTSGQDEEEYDMVVIGGGSGGIRASRISSGYGKKVAIIEPQMEHGAPMYSAIGGTCVNVGCVPKKLMVFASRYPGMIKEMKGYGWDGATPGTFSWSDFMAAKDKEISRLNNVYQKFVLNPAGVEIVQGFGSLDGKGTVLVKDAEGNILRTMKAKNTVVATGGWPYMPDIPGAEHAITSNEIFYLKEQPKRIVVSGGGFVALEFAQILDGMGSDVTLMYRGDLFLRGFDRCLREELRKELETNSGIDMQFNTNPAEIIKNDDGSLTVVTEDGNRVETDVVLIACGRLGKTDGLNLESAGVNMEGTFIPVNKYSETNVEGIYAVGDVTDRIALTPVALNEGHCLADTLFGGKDRPSDHEFVASTVFTTPELATVGYSEEAAAEKFKDITVFRTRFRAMSHSFPGTETYTFFKLIVDTATDKVVGVHMVGDSAGEMMQGVAVAVKMGATKADFDATIGIHPTSAEEFVTMRSPSYHYKDGVKVED